MLQAVTLRSLVLVSLLGVTSTAASAHADAPSADACATASDNAQPLLKARKLRAAKQQLLICVSKSCPSMVRDDCASQLNGIEKAMPTIVFAATDAQGADLSAVIVKMDGQQLADHLDGTPLAVDPGEHEFRFETSGRSPVFKKLVVHETEKERRVALSFAAQEAPPSPSEGPTSDQSTSSPTPWVAYTALGIGAVGLIVGVIFTVSALNQNSTLSGECTLPNGGCAPQYQNQVNNLNTDQIVAGVGYGVALVGAGIGTYLLLTSGSSTSPAPATTARAQVQPQIGLGWLGLGGQFQ